MARKDKIMGNGALRDVRLFTVEGSGLFPFDMLRYDACWPFTEAHDSTKLDGHYDRARRRVVLATYRPSAPTEGRWESFGWKVIGLGEWGRDLGEQRSTTEEGQGQ